MRLKTKKLLYISVLLVLFFAFYHFALWVSRFGEIKLSIHVSPKTSNIRVNGKEVPGDSIHLGPGNYIVVASSEGFTDAVEEISIEREDADVYLLPEPSSDSAREWLRMNPEIQKEREAIGGIIANKKGLEIKQKIPLVEILPYSDLVGPFSIDYGPSPTRKNDAFLIVSNSSPKGRQNALRWIRQNGYDPTDLEIRFADFNNPLSASLAGEGEYRD